MSVKDAYIWISNLYLGVKEAIKQWSIPLRECKNFCVNGHQAGNRRYFVRSQK
jgi:hypothetical protein